MSILDQLQTSYLLILTKLQKLFFTILLLETLLFRFLCQELQELNKQRYLELMSIAAYGNVLPRLVLVMALIWEDGNLLAYQISMRYLYPQLR